MAFQEIGGSRFFLLFLFAFGLGPAGETAAVAAGDAEVFQAQAHALFRKADAGADLL